MIYVFGEFELDADLYELRRAGEALRIPPKTFDVLRCLIEHRDRVVSKRELLEKLWPGETVTESVLPTNITAIRKALGDERTEARMIQTLHGRGYRFVAPVEVLDEAPTPQPAGPRPGGEQAPAAAPEGPAFVGREAVMAELRALLEDALVGRGRLALLVGEPGIGKTRTIEELCAEARPRGVRVLEGRAYEGEGAPAYWPFVQILRDAIRNTDGAVLREQMSAGAPDIAQLVPELRDRFSELPVPEALESNHARFRLFESLATFVRNASRARPAILVLDDLHWADEPTLLLLQFLARELRAERVFILGAYRDVEVRRHHPLAPTLGELARHPHFRRISLSGLSKTDVARCVGAATGSEPREDLVRAVYEMTEGNPFFVHQTVQLLASQDRLETPEEATSLSVTLPQGVRDVIGRRLDGLSTGCNQLLALASVIGRDFALHVLERVAEAPAETVLELLDEAVEAGILVDASDAEEDATPLPLSRYAFSHALVRETLYEELSGPERVRLHRRVGQVLELLHGEDAIVPLSELAHHFFQAAPSGDAEKAVAYAERAAVQAVELLAFEESVGHYQRALQALEFSVPVDPARRCELTLALGWAQSRITYQRGTESFRRAAEIARRIGRPDLLGRAAMGLGGWPLSAGKGPTEPNEEFRAAVEEALRDIDEGDRALRARLVAGLAVTPPDQDSMETRDRLSRQALELARQAGDFDALLDALYARLWALNGPGDIERRLEVSTEFLALAEKVGNKEKIFTGRENRIRSLLALDDPAETDRDLDAFEQLAEELRLPPYVYSVTRFRAARALLDGRFDEAEKFVARSRELGIKANDPGVRTVGDFHEVWLLRERGRLAEIAPLFESIVERNEWLAPFPSAAVAFLYSSIGDAEAARRHFDRAWSRDIATLARDEHWLLTVVFLAEVCADFADTRRAALLYDLLEPYAEGDVAHLTGRFYFGSAAATLGRLAAVLGRREVAIRHFEAALERSRRLGRRPRLARTQLAFAGFLLRRDAGDAPAPEADRHRARALLSEAAATAETLGMPELLGRVRALG
jgi:DNA-binding winged helix-turn-helix (wHTH) protein/tetratricopeptide (TPR) repeat protein